MMRFSLIALLLCIWASASHAYQFELRGGQICKSPYKQLFTERGWRCYAFYQQKKTFANAKAHCIAEGGMLATIHSDKVYNFIEQNIKTLKPVPVLSSWGKLFTKWSRGYWLGSTKIGGIYQWFDQGPVAKYWLKDQPDAGLGLQTEECLSQMAAGWNDAPCTWETRFVCERKPSFYG